MAKYRPGYAYPYYIKRRCHILKFWTWFRFGATIFRHKTLIKTFKGWNGWDLAIIKKDILNLKWATMHRRMMDRIYAPYGRDEDGNALPPKPEIKEIERLSIPHALLEIPPDFEIERQ